MPTPRSFLRCRPWTAALLALLVVIVPIGSLSRAKTVSVRTGPHPTPGIFFVKPYLQPGNQPALMKQEAVVVLWQAIDADAAWRVQWRPRGESTWREASPPEERKVQLGRLPATRLLQSRVAGLTPGGLFEYRVLRNGEPAFSAQGQARKPAGVHCRMVVVGDTGEGTAGEKAVASRIFSAAPDLVCIVGDITQAHGRMGEYWKYFFPVFNADTPRKKVGVPLSRSTLFIAAAGNHDTSFGNLHDARDMNAYGDTMAWFVFWSLPLNGPFGPGAANTPRLKGSMAHQQALLDAAGNAYPRMACYSYDYGDVHWLVIDSNDYVDPTDPDLRAWIARDLEAARGARWRLVALHHAPFHSSRLRGHHGRMALLADLFEKGGVDIVFAGHVHDYERSAPLRFTPRRNKRGRLMWKSGRIQGTTTIDNRFDGVSETRPDGVIYVVSGAGGAQLYGTDRENNTTVWQPFTRRYIADVHSFTQLDVTPTSLLLREISKAGKVMDEIRITR